MSGQQTLRDTFAAAAMSGVIATTAGYTLESFARECYEHADAMLRERGVTNHDAAPAARAKACDGTGNTPSLAAGARAENREGGSGDRHPLHSSPASAVTDDRPAPTAATITDAEREALEWFAKFGNASLATMSNAWTDHAATLRGLLARLGGDA